MAPVSRTAQFAHVFKVLKKHYKPVVPHPDRPVLEHLLLACCLQNAHYEAADEAFGALVETFFDWNEIRVSTLSELAEVMSALPDPRAAANRVKRVLQSVFEATYAFDLEEWRKKNLGPTVKWFQQIDGTTPFTVAYVVQTALGGHAIPVDESTLAALRVVDLVSDQDVEAGVVPGLERAVAKSKGIEFGSRLHQLGADFTVNPYSPAVREILLEIDPECQARLPKRRAQKAPEVPRGTATQAAGAAAEEPSGETAPSGKSPRKSAGKRSGTPKASAGKRKSKSAEKSPSASKQKSASGKAASSSDVKRPSASKGLSKRKPR